MGSECLKERKKREQEREAQVFHALTCRKKQLAESKRAKKHKKKSVDELLPLLAIKNIRYHALRPAEEYVPRSYNLERQLIGLLDHLFVRFPVPYFLYQACLADTTSGTNSQIRKMDPRHLSQQETYRNWFVTLAQGGSFPKRVKGIMTSKEACAFLRAPWDRPIHENVWWAKMKVAGVPETLIGRLIDRIFTNYSFEDPDGRLGEAALFYARHHPDLDKNSFDEVTDFLAWKLRHDHAFRIKGRTASSAIKLSNEWHLQMQRAKLGQHIQWKGLQFADWEYEAKTEVWDVIELRDNKELVNEGRKQKHCVYSYVQRCVEGRCAIFSMRAYRKFASGDTEEGKPVWDKTYETRRITIEVSPQRVVIQVKGPWNRAPNPEERSVLRRWAGEKGVRTAATPEWY